MKKSLIGIMMALVLVCTLVLGSVQVFAGISPYQEISFAEPDDYEQDEVNEFHQDVLKFEENAGIPNVGGTFDGAWLSYESFSFGGVGAVAVKVSYCNNSGRCAADSQIEVWIDGISTADGGTKVGTVDLPATAGNWDTYADVEANLDTVVTGDHDIYMVLVGSTSTNTPFIANLRTFEFVKGEGEEPTETPAPSEEATATPEATEEATPAPTETPTEAPKQTTAAPKVTTPAASATVSATQGSADEVQNNDSTMVVVIVVVAVVVIAAAVAAFVIIKKKKG